MHVYVYSIAEFIEMSIIVRIIEAENRVDRMETMN